MKLKDETLSKLKKIYFFYLIPIFFVNIFVDISFLGLDFYHRNYFSFKEFFTKEIQQMIPHLFFLSSIIGCFIYSKNKYLFELDLQKFSKRISDNLILIVSIIQILQAMFVYFLAISEISKEPKYYGSIIIYLIVGVSIFYQFIIITIFLTYTATQIIDRKFKILIFEETKLLFPHGKEKISYEIIISFFVIGILPILILVLFQIHTAEGDFFKGDRIYLIGTFIVLLFGNIACFAFQKELISIPIINLVSAMKEVENGNFKIRLPVSKSNELSLLSNQFNEMLNGLEEKEKIKDEFGKYLSPEVAKEILNSGKNIWDGEEKEITVLFTDIEGFTSLSERLEAKEIVNLLNEYFTELVKIISENKGVVNKFIGDSILAIYNAPLNDESHADNSLKTAIQISKLNEEKEFSSNLKVRTRVGINTGKVIIGNLGSIERLEYTVIGDTVNVAQRLESMNKELGTSILISEKTKSILKENYTFHLEKKVSVKGRKETIQVFGI